MKFGKVSFLLIAFSIAFFCPEIGAQNSKLPKQIKLLDNSGAIPFEDGKTIVAELIFTGLDTSLAPAGEDEEKNLLTENELRYALRANRAPINAGEEFFGYKVAKAVKVMREWLSLKGYDKPEVAAFGEKLGEDEMKLIFSIERGALARVSEIVFEGQRNLSGQELAADFKQCRKIDWQVFESGKYEYITRRCTRNFMFERGFFKSQIKNVDRRPSENGYVVTVKIEEGARFRLGEIKIAGVKAFTENEILKMHGQKEGEIADGAKMQDFFFEKLKEAYADKGYLLYNAEFEPVYTEPLAEGLDGIVNINVTIDEGKQFKISRLRFTGVDAETEKKVKRKFAVVENEIYNQSKLRSEFKKLNAAEEFYPVDIDSTAVDLLVDDFTGEVEIIVRLDKLG